MKVEIYVEGGGDTRALRNACRAGFRAFFRKAGLAERLPSIIACGSRDQALRRFRIAVAKTNRDTFALLLVDSEGPIAINAGPWQHLRQRDNWERPEQTTDDNAHLLVECMESWFLADKGCLARHFGSQFSANALPKDPEVERIPKRALLDGLKNATRQCSAKGPYDKGKHSFDILALIDPANVTNASPYAKRLIDLLKDRLG